MDDANRIEIRCYNSVDFRNQIWWNDPFQYDSWLLYLDWRIN